MRSVRSIAAIALAALAVCTQAPAKPFPTFSAVVEGPGRVALSHGGTVVLRWRSLPGETGAGLVAGAAERLNAVAWQGASATSFAVAKAAPIAPPKARGRVQRGPDALLQVEGRTLLRVDGAHAALAGSTPEALATAWARNLGAAFAGPYVMARAGALRVPVGETRRAALGGRPGPGAALRTESPAVASGQLTAGGALLTVRGEATGMARFVITAGVYDAVVTAEVRPWAVLVAGPVAAQVTGRGAAAEWAASCVSAALWQRLAPAPGAEARLSEVRLGHARAGVVLDASAPGCFTVHRRVQVPLVSQSLAPATPERTVICNEPERVTGPAVLTRVGLAEGQPTTLLWHHVAAGATGLAVRVSLANTGDTPARVHVLGGDGGPTDDEVYAGHAAMQRFVSASTDGTGCVFSVPPDSRVEVCRLAMPAGEVVSGLARLRALAGEGVAAEVEALPSTAPVAYWEPLEEPLPPPVGPLLELPGAKQIAVRHEVGRAWQFLRIGKAPEGVTLHPRLRGDYGVQHDIEVVFNNPTGIEARLEIGLRGGGGTARAVVETDGRVVETGLLSSGVEEVLYRQRSSAREVRVHLRMMPQSGSNYPLTLTARSFALP